MNLLFHRVLPDRDRSKALAQPGMCVTQSTFAGQMKFLRRHYHPVSLEYLADSYRDGKTIPWKTVTISFDDGWVDNYGKAFPILREYGIPATIFLATDLIERNSLPVFIEVSLLLGEHGVWPDVAVSAFMDVIGRFDLAGGIPGLDVPGTRRFGNDAATFMITLLLLDKKYIRIIADEIMARSGIDRETWNKTRRGLSPEELKIMNDGGIYFGSHGKTHNILTTLNPDQIMIELKQSKEYIEKILGKPVCALSYPNHNYNADIKTMARKIGYKFAAAGMRVFDENEHEPDLFAIKRQNINEGACVGPTGKFSRTIFACNINGLL
jgi:peptidoglycan/xylan/chitin deacetylase (PgdA/CDA1 family)